jgi:hypothetical protein
VCRCSSIKEQKVTRRNKCTRPHLANTRESPAFTKPIQMFYGTMSCQSTVPHVKGAGNLSEHPGPSCAAHVCTLVACDTVGVPDSGRCYLLRLIRRHSSQRFLSSGRTDSKFLRTFSRLVIPFGKDTPQTPHRSAPGGAISSK